MKYQIISYFCQLNSKGIKKTLNILSKLVAVLTIIFATIPILLHFSKIQNYIADVVTQELTKKLDSEVHLEHIDYQLFNSIQLRNFSVQDLDNDTLLHVESLKARFKFWQLFRGNVIITGVELHDFNGNLKVDSLGKTNLDFVIKAFEKAEKKESKVQYHVGSFKLINSSFSFTNIHDTIVFPADRFNPNKFRFQHINADISLDILTKDSLSVRVNNFTGIESSGLTLKKLTTQLLGSNKGIRLPYFEVHLPYSKLNLENISMDFDSIAALKDFAEKVRWSAPIVNSYFSLSDFSSIIPEFKNIRGISTLNGIISGRQSSLRFEDIEVKYGKSFVFHANLDVNGYTNPEDAFVFGEVSDLMVERADLQDFIADITGKPFILPKELVQLGKIQFNGNISGFLSNLVAYGNFKTNLGSLSTDILLKFENNLQDLTYNGTLKSSNFQMGRFLADSKFGKLAFSINTQGAKKHDAPLRGNVKASVQEFNFNGYAYRDIVLDGEYDGTGFNGEIDVQDENINAHFIGIIDVTKKIPVYDFDLKMKNTNLHALKLIDEYPDALLSLEVKTNLTGRNVDDFNGFVSVDSVYFQNKQKVFSLNQLLLVSQTERDFTHVTLTSDYVNGVFSGNYKFSSLEKSFNSFVRRYLPALANEMKPNGSYAYNDMEFNLTFENLNDIMQVLDLPYSTSGLSEVKGSLNDKTGLLKADVFVPSFQSGKQLVENISFSLDARKEAFLISSGATMQHKKGPMDVFLTASALNDSVSTQIGWHNHSQITNAGEIQAVAKFNKEHNGKFTSDVFIRPTQIIIADSVWDVRPSTITFNPDSSIYIRDFRFENNTQFIHIDGLASRFESDALNFDLNDINLDFIFGELLSLKGIYIGGNATGKLKVASTLSKPIFEADLFVEKVKLNNRIVADANIVSSWDADDKKINLAGTFFNGNDTVALATGAFVPRNDSLDLTFFAKNLSVEFLNRYFEGVVENFQGLASGTFRLFGPTKNILYEGELFVNKGQFTVDMLKTTYFFNDSVHLSHYAIDLKNITLYDEERNQGSLTGRVDHNGDFRNLRYDVNLRARNVLAMNTTSVDDDFFYGKAYLTGTVGIFGNEDEVNINVSGVSQPKTKCYLQLGSASTASDNSFIFFVDKTKTDSQIATTNGSTQESRTNIKVDLQIDVTPDAEIEMIVDPKAGDFISARGNGNIRIQFDTFSDVKLYGSVVVEQGSYLFTFQTLLRKEFKIDRGSTIMWSGDPFAGRMDVRAIYSLTASLADLMDSEELANTTSRTNVPVNCILLLTDDLMSPSIKFDIDLPSSDESVKQRVKSIISTDEMMNRQIGYLLFMNKFYPPDYSSSNYLPTNDGMSFLTSTASSHINNILRQSLNITNLSLGFDWQRNQEIDEWKTQVLYQFNDRLVFNGNFGYRNDMNYSSSENRLITDFDVEYLLTKNGKLRARFYNHAIDRAQLRVAKNTQGLGFIYREDFYSVNDMFAYYWRIFTGNKKEDNNEEVKVEE